MAKVLRIDFKACVWKIVALRFGGMFEKLKAALPFLFKKILLPFLIFAPISVVIALFIAEKMVQYANPQLTYKIARLESLRVYKKSDFLPFELKPNLNITHIGNTHEFSYTVKTNSLGFRMDEFSVEKPNDEFRILMLGDSMTFGYGVEVAENLPSRLEKKLNEYLMKNGVNGKKVKIINAGFADGKSPDTYYLYLKKLGVDLKPDLLIINYFINNDVADLDDTVWEKVDSEGLPEKISSRTTYIDDDYTRLKGNFQNWKFAVPVLRDSNLWILFSTALESKSPETVVRVKKFLNISDSPLISEGEVFSCIFDSLCNEKMNLLTDKYFEVLKATTDLAKTNNVPLIVSLLPANPQVKKAYEGLSGFDFSSLKDPKGLEGIVEKLADLNPQKQIMEKLNGLDVGVIDPLPYMARPDYRDLYFEKDGHATKLGNERFSQAFFDYLTSQWKIGEKVK